MSLIDKLRSAADKLPPSQVPSLNELAGTVGAIVAHIEHGNNLFTAAEQGAEEVARLFAPAAATVAESVDPQAAPIIGAIEDIVQAEHTPAPVAPVAPEPPAEAPSSEVESLRAQAAQAQKDLEAIQTAIAAAQRGEVSTGGAS